MRLCLRAATHTQHGWILDSQIRIVVPVNLSPSPFYSASSTPWLISSRPQLPHLIL